MNFSDFRKRLQEKEQELLADMAQHEAEARKSSGPDVGDLMDRVVSSEDTEEQFQQATSDWHVIGQVRDALDRIDKGTYGVCIDCGRRIEPDRLQAIPWTAYCADDQSRHDRGPTGEPPAEPTL